MTLKRPVGNGYMEIFDSLKKAAKEWDCSYHLIVTAIHAKKLLFGVYWFYIDTFDLEGEIWTPITGYDNYQISIFGRIQYPSGMKRYMHYDKHHRPKIMIKRNKVWDRLDVFNLMAHEWLGVPRYHEVIAVDGDYGNFSFLNMRVTYAINPIVNSCLGRTGFGGSG
jgi:hypothetical protein